jgi:hypothetical protein
MKLILCLFEELSGLKINFHKSEIFCFGKAKEEEDQYRQIFGCDAGSLPFKAPFGAKDSKTGECREPREWKRCPVRKRRITKTQEVL